LGETELEQADKKPTRLTPTDQMRKRFKGVLDPIAGFLNRLGLHPNTVTILGLIGNTIGAYFLATGQMTIGGLLILAMGPVDALDGTMARLRGEASNFGAFVDSVTDRYSELVIFGGLLFFYLQQGVVLYAMLAYLAAAGAILVSYTRARSQSVGLDTKVGILTRMERYIVLAPLLVLSRWFTFTPEIALWILAIFANITALQRILDVRRQAHQQKDAIKG
jgi:CDP-diacylglycerol--glycerol-3-phosphate 3-phosphatidyltransferase